MPIESALVRFCTKHKASNCTRKQKDQLDRSNLAPQNGMVADCCRMDNEKTSETKHTAGEHMRTDHFLDDMTLEAE